MDTRPLGRTGLQVSAISYGVMTFGGATSDFFRPVGTTERKEAAAIVGRCIDAGVNLFDTADVYSNGASEEILGAALGSRRGEVLVATKAHGRMGDGPNDLGGSRRHLIRACEASLRRLGTDWIDLYQLHGFDGLTAVEETLGALDDLVRTGKVRHVGCSNFSAWHLMKSLGISEREHVVRHASLQANYSLVARELEYELVPLCLDQAVGILVWSPLAGGFLTGKFRRGEQGPAESRRAQMGGRSPGVGDEERGFDIVETLVEIAGARGVSAAQVALNYLLAKPGVTSLVVGARTLEQLDDNLAASSWSLDPEEVERLDDVSATPPPYPYWHQLTYNAERMTEPWLHAAAARAAREAATRW